MSERRRERRPQEESRPRRRRGRTASLSWISKRDSDRGASLTLRHALGASSAGGLDALLSSNSPERRPANDLERPRFEASAGYVFAAFGGRFTATPRAGCGWSDSEHQYSLGWELSRNALELNLETLWCCFPEYLGRSRPFCTGLFRLRILVDRD